MPIRTPVLEPRRVLRSILTWNSNLCLIQPCQGTHTNFKEIQNPTNYSVTLFTPLWCRRYPTNNLVKNCSSLCMGITAPKGREGQSPAGPKGSKPVRPGSVCDSVLWSVQWSVRAVRPVVHRVVHRVVRLVVQIEMQMQKQINYFSLKTPICVWFRLEHTNFKEIQNWFWKNHNLTKKIHFQVFFFQFIFLQSVFDSDFQGTHTSFKKNTK